MIVGHEVFVQSGFIDPSERYKPRVGGLPRQRPKYIFHVLARVMTSRSARRWPSLLADPFDGRLDIKPPTNPI